jgi:hypothetical protein
MLVVMQTAIHVQKHHTTDYVLYTSHESGHEIESISFKRHKHVVVHVLSGNGPGVE